MAVTGLCRSPQSHLLLSVPQSHVLLLTLPAKRGGGRAAPRARGPLGCPLASGAHLCRLASPPALCSW